MAKQINKARKALANQPVSFEESLAANGLPGIVASNPSHCSGHAVERNILVLGRIFTAAPLNAMASNRLATDYSGQIGRAHV